MIEVSLPRHKRDYQTHWEEGFERTEVFVICPKCTQLTETDWDQMEAGSKHKCESCSYEWVLVSD